MIAEPTLQAVQQMREVLTAADWYMNWDCFEPCMKEYWEHPDKSDYEVVMKKNMAVAWIMMKGHVICGPIAGYELADKLKQYVP